MVKSHGLDGEAGGKRSHVELVDAIFIDECQRRLHNQVVAEACFAGFSGSHVAFALHRPSIQCMICCTLYDNLDAVRRYDTNQGKWNDCR